MKITFLGAAQTGTGSCYVIETGSSRFAVDCGMFQGNSAIEERNFQTDAYRPENLDFILLTHAHIDHSGLLPRMVKKGFKGSIYCTRPTAELASIMLEDSAHIQEMDHEWKSRHDKRRGASEVAGGEPLYETEDALATAKLLHPVNFDDAILPAPGVKVVFRHAGHILGAAFLELTVEEEGKSTRIVFSGDLGRPGALLLPTPKSPTPPTGSLWNPPTATAITRAKTTPSKNSPKPSITASAITKRSSFRPLPWNARRKSSTACSS